MRLSPRDVNGLRKAAIDFAARVAPAIIDHEVETKDYVPLFIDATAIKVDGQLFQWSRNDYNGNRGYWLHTTFLSGLWSAGHCHRAHAKLAQASRLNRGDGATGHAGMASCRQRLLRGCDTGWRVRRPCLGLLD